MSNFVDSSNLGVILTKIKSWAEGKFLTEHQDISGKVDKVSGKGLSTNDFTTTLKNKLDGIASGAEVNVQSDWNATSGDAMILNKPTIPTIPNLSKGTTSGSGNAVTDISVSGHTVTLTKGTTFLTEHQDISGKVDKVTGKGLSTNDFTTTLKNKLDGIASGAEVNVQSDWNQTTTTADDYIKNKPTIPTNTNQLTNGAGFQTASQVSTAISNAIKDITSFEYEVVTALPATGVKGKIYLVAHAHGTGDAYDEYIWTGSAFEKIGNTDVDLSGYQKKNVTVYVHFLSGGNYTFKSGYADGSAVMSFADVKALIDNNDNIVRFYDTDENMLMLGDLMTGLVNIFIEMVSIPSADQAYAILYTFSPNGTYTISNKRLVFTTRKINNKTLASDITLTASDVGAAPSTVLDSLDFSDPAAASTTSTTFIDSVSQTDGKISATKKTLPTASSSVAGITKVGASGGAAAYSHSHSYTNDSALTAAQIKTAFVNAGYYTDSNYPS